MVKSVLGAEGQINITTLFDLLPGAKRQVLHQDDGIWSKGGSFGDAGIPRPHPSFLCNALIAIDDFDEENGATWYRTATCGTIGAHLTKQNETWKQSRR